MKSDEPKVTKAEILQRGAAVWYRWWRKRPEYPDNDAAKAEVDAFITTMIHQAGLEHLRSQAPSLAMQAEPPVKSIGFDNFKHEGGRFGE